jgi:hypothetical protein
MLSIAPSRGCLPLKVLFGVYVGCYILGSFSENTPKRGLSAGCFGGFLPKKVCFCDFFEKIFEKHLEIKIFAVSLHP